ncbi:unnamed protein product (mitochondrion) [Plasmodiophora brassicae]|uniref:Dynamin N-terminal domain-containing protein n=1 Tax=Plasmodiophora brassicae TaxID=37360 RepID=A0A3P3YJH2_PLABS|nr:unnamed protein product [Plasmodiophora brassicae]
MDASGRRSLRSVRMCVQVLLLGRRWMSAVARHVALGPLSPQHQRVVDAEKRLLDDLARAVHPTLAPASADLSTIRGAVRHLDELFCMTVIGEFNSGKSTFINALLGERVCQEGVTPTTNAVTTVRYGRSVSSSPLSSLSGQVVMARSPWLKDSVIVDTPGTNAIVAGHEEVTEEIIPRSDLVFFITSVDRPFSESERQFMEKIVQWRRNIVIVVNKVDVLDHEGDLDLVLRFVRDNVQKLLHLTPPIFAVSGKLALNEKVTGRKGAALPGARSSGFDALEEFIQNSLSDKDKMQLKLANPLGVAERLMDKYEGVLECREKLAQVESDTLAGALHLLDTLSQQTRSTFGLHQHRVENVLLRLLERIDEFLDAKLRLSNVRSLVSQGALAAAFQSEVVGQFTEEVDAIVREAADWLVEQNVSRAQAVASYLDNADKRNVVDSSQIGLSLTQGRQALTREVSQELVGTVRSALLATAAFEASAFGVGAVVASAASVDVTGLAGAGALAVTGLLVLPYRRHELRQTFRSHLASVKKQLNMILEQHLGQELERGVGMVQSALQPFRARVDTERARLQLAGERLRNARKDLDAIRESIRQLSTDQDAKEASVAELPDSPAVSPPQGGQPAAASRSAPVPASPDTANETLVGVRVDGGDKADVMKPQ